MRLRIHFVEGAVYMNGGVAVEFDISDNHGYQSNRCASGVCTNGWLDSNDKKYSDIYVVRQGDVFKTGVILVHELCHAFIWLAGLPDKWNGWIDDHI